MGIQDLNPHLSGFKSWADLLCSVNWQCPSARPPRIRLLCPMSPSKVRFLGDRTPPPAPKRATKPQHRAVTFDSRPLDLFLDCLHPHLPQPEPAGDMQVTMATAHRILTWGPTGSTGEGQALPQRNGWRGGGQGAGGALRRRPRFLCGPGWAQAAIYNSAEWAQ